MRRLMNVVAAGRVDLKPLVTHRFKLDQVEQAYELFANQRDGVLKVAVPRYSSDSRIDSWPWALAGGSFA
jgi:hypothetical protein